MYLYRSNYIASKNCEVCAKRGCAGVETDIRCRNIVRKIYLSSFFDPLVEAPTVTKAFNSLLIILFCCFFKKDRMFYPFN